MKNGTNVLFLNFVFQKKLLSKEKTNYHRVFRFSWNFWSTTTFFFPRYITRRVLSYIERVNAASTYYAVMTWNNLLSLQL